MLAAAGEGIMMILSFDFFSNKTPNLQAQGRKQSLAQEKALCVSVWLVSLLCVLSLRDRQHAQQTNMLV